MATSGHIDRRGMLALVHAYIQERATVSYGEAYISEAAVRDYLGERLGAAGYWVDPEDHAGTGDRRRYDLGVRAKRGGNLRHLLELKVIKKSTSTFESYRALLVDSLKLALAKEQHPSASCTQVVVVKMGSLVKLLPLKELSDKAPDYEMIPYVFEMHRCLAEERGIDWSAMVAYSRKSRVMAGTAVSMGQRIADFAAARRKPVVVQTVLDHPNWGAKVQESAQALADASVTSFRYGACDVGYAGASTWESVDQRLGTIDCGTLLDGFVVMGVDIKSVKVGSVT